MHSIAYDAVNDEFTVPHQFGQSIMTYRGGAKGAEAPIRIIQGPLTQLRAPDRLDVDTVHNEIFVPEGWAVLVFERGAQGNVAPKRILTGPNDAPFNASSVAVDPINNVLIVGSAPRGGAARLYIFNRTDEGSAKPRGVISGPKSGLRSIGGPVAVYPPKRAIIASNRGEVSVLATPESYVGVWSIDDNGDVPPKWRIGGPNGVLQMPRGIALDPRNKALLVSDKRLNAVLTFYFPEMF